MNGSARVAKVRIANATQSSKVALMPVTSSSMPSRSRPTLLESTDRKPSDTLDGEDGRRPHAPSHRTRSTRRRVCHQDYEDAPDRHYSNATWYSHTSGSNPDNTRVRG